MKLSRSSVCGKYCRTGSWDHCTHPAAAMTTGHRLGGLKKQKWSLSLFWRLQAQNQGDSIARELLLASPWLLVATDGLTDLWPTDNHCNLRLCLYVMTSLVVSVFN